MRDVLQQGHLPVQVSRLRSAMPHPEPGAGPTAEVRGKCPVSHQRPENHLYLLSTAELLLRADDSISCYHLPSRAPPARRTHKISLSHYELSPALLLLLAHG